MANKKILYIVTKSSYGGAGKYVYDHAIEMQSEGYEVVVAAGGEGLLKDKLEQQNIRTINIPKLERDISIFKEFYVLKSLLTILENEQPDIIHLNSSKIGGIGALAGRLKKVPQIIFTSHGWAFNEDRGVLWKTFTYIASWITVILSKKIITISEKELKQALNFPFVSPKKIHMIYNGIGNIYFKEKNEARKYIEQQAGINIQQDTIVIGSVGELHKNKGYKYAIEMCQALKEQNKKIIYLIIGEGEERKSLTKQIDEKNLNDVVKILGAIPDTSSGATLMDAFDIFLLPSTKEGLAYVVLEAGMAGKPVIATHIGGVPEIIKNGVSGILVNKKNSKGLVDAINELIEDEEKREEFGKSLKKNVLNKFSLEKMVKETKKIY